MPRFRRTPPRRSRKTRGRVRSRISGLFPFSRNDISNSSQIDGDDGGGNSASMHYDSITEVVPGSPFGIGIVNNWQSYTDNLFDKAMRAGWDENGVTSTINTLNEYIPSFIAWVADTAQQGVSYGQDQLGNSIYTIDDFLNNTGNQHRWCGDCYGSIGQCNFCSNIDVETNIGGNNWKLPHSWKITSVNITLYVTF